MLPDGPDQPSTGLSMQKDRTRGLIGAIDGAIIRVWPSVRVFSGVILAAGVVGGQNHHILRSRRTMAARIDSPDQISPDVFREFMEWRARKSQRRRTPQEIIALHLDRAIADALKHGMPYLDKDGVEARRPPTAAEWSAASRRLEQIYRERVDQEQRARAAEAPTHGPPPGYEPPRRASK